jgi:transcriptional regulator with XRE-family HTH domain
MVGKQIKYYRLQKQIKQEDLAEYLGVSYQAVSKWETEQSNPDIALLPRIAEYFGVSIDELFEWSYEEQMSRIENMVCNQNRIDAYTFDSAIDFLTKRLRIDPNDKRALINLTDLYNHRAKSDHVLASNYAQKVLEIDPEEKAGWIGFLEANNGLCGDEWYDNHFEVIRFFETFLKKNPGNFWGLYGILENLIADGRYDEALPYIDELKKKHKNYQYLLYLGDVAFGKGNLSEARKYWEQMVKDFPETWQAFCSLGDGYAKLGMYDKAIDKYQKSYDMQERPRIAEGLCSLAQLYELNKRYDKAIKAYRELIKNLKEDYGITEGEMVDRYVREIARIKRLK